MIITTIIKVFIKRKIYSVEITVIHSTKTSRGQKGGVRSSCNK